MTGKTDTFLNAERVAELWERIRQALDAKQDRVERDAATDAEVTEMLDEVFGFGGGYEPEEQPTATEAEVAEMLDEIFGSGSSGGSGETDVAADSEISEMLNEVFGRVSRKN